MSTVAKTSHKSEEECRQMMNVFSQVLIYPSDLFQLLYYALSLMESYF